MHHLEVTQQLSDEAVEQLKQDRVKMDSTYYDTLVTGDENVEVFADGRTPFRVVRDVIDPLSNDNAFDVFEKAYQSGSAAYRGIAAGVEPDPHASSVSVGYLDRTARHGLKPCRETTFSLKNAALFGEAIPYIQAVDDVFRTYMPRHWFYQHFVASLLQRLEHRQLVLFHRCGQSELSDGLPHGQGRPEGQLWGPHLF